MAGKCIQSLMKKTLSNVIRSQLSNTDKECIKNVFERYAEEHVWDKTCGECVHEEYCRFPDMKFSVRSKVRDLLHDCKDFEKKMDQEKCEEEYLEYERKAGVC